MQKFRMCFIRWIRNYELASECCEVSGYIVMNCLFAIRNRSLPNCVWYHLRQRQKVTEGLPPVPFWRLKRNFRTAALVRSSGSIGRAGMDDADDRLLFLFT